MDYRLPSHVRRFTTIRETDIRDYYLAYPLVTCIRDSQAAHLHARPIPLPICRLTRRGRS